MLFLISKYTRKEKNMYWLIFHRMNWYKCIYIETEISSRITNFYWWVFHESKFDYRTLCFFYWYYSIIVNRLRTFMRISQFFLGDFNFILDLLLFICQRRELRIRWYFSWICGYLMRLTFLLRICTLYQTFSSFLQ